MSNPLITQDGGNRMRRTGQREYQEWLRAPATPPPSSTGVGDFIRILRRRRNLVIGVIGTIVLLTFLVIARMTPIYSTTAVVMIEPMNAMPGAETSTAVTNSVEELRIATKQELLASRALARRLVKRLRLDETEEFAPSDKKRAGLFDRAIALVAPARATGQQAEMLLDPEDRAEAREKARMEEVTDKLMSQVAVERMGNSHMISITASSIDPYMAALIANRLAETHIKTQLSEKHDSEKAYAEQLGEQVEEMRRQVQAADQAVATYRRDHGLVLDKPEDFTQAQMTRLAGSLAEARAQSASSAVRASGGADSAASPVLNDLRGQQVALRKRLSELTSFYGRGYPEVASTQAQLDEIGRRIAIESARAASTVSREAAADSARAGELAGEIGGLRSTGISNGFADVGLRELERNAQTSNALYVTLLAKLKEVTGEGHSENADTSIVSRAPVPDNPSYPKPRRALGVALIASLILAFVIALLAEMLDDRFRSAEQVRRQIGLPTLAMVPQLPDSMSESPAQEIVRQLPRSSFAEALRGLVKEVESRRTRPGGQVVVVTSAVPEEGKSTITAGIAAAAAGIGRTAVMVDLDMRSRDPADAPATQGEADLVAYLTDRAEIEHLLPDDAAPSTIPVLAVHQPVLDPGALLESPRLHKLFADLRQRFDLVIVNAPSILVANDARTLADMTDGALMVLRWGHSDPSAVRVAVEAMGGGVIGVVMNRVDYAKHARRHYGDSIQHSQRLLGRSRADHGSETASRTPLLSRLRKA